MVQRRRSYSQKKLFKNRNRKQSKKQRGGLSFNSLRRTAKRGLFKTKTSIKNLRRRIKLGKTKSSNTNGNNSDSKPKKETGSRSFRRSLSLVGKKAMALFNIKGKNTVASRKNTNTNVAPRKNTNTNVAPRKNTNTIVASPMSK